ncbi:hypothetical protein [Streptomyces sp. CAU 1734]|uniref:hypothetical protein n=1 Tax=Streptomyces sp. CAU 1734 TaxID=3140360 RepID=UPI00326111B1
MSSRPVPGRRSHRTTTIVWETAYLRVRVHDGVLRWFLRDVARALAFRPPLASSAVPRVLVTTDELWSVMTSARFRPPTAFTAWATDLADRLPRNTAGHQS